MSADVRDAVVDNLQWCALVCRAHGIPTQQSGGIWFSTRSAPDRFPDVMTTRPGVAIADVVAACEHPGRSAGAEMCSVKDSFADVELAGEGFSELFAAQWIRRGPGEDRHAGYAELRWQVVDSVGQFDAWTRATDTAATLTRAVWADPSVHLLAAYHRGALAGCAVASTGTAAVGLSNVVVVGADVGHVWQSLAHAVPAMFGARPIVGYEHGDDLAAAVDAGFRLAGPLRVWLRQSSGHSATT